MESGIKNHEKIIADLSAELERKSAAVSKLQAEKEAVLKILQDNTDHKSNMETVSLEVSVDTYDKLQDYAQHRNLSEKEVAEVLISTFLGLPMFSRMQFLNFLHGFIEWQRSTLASCTGKQDVFMKNELEETIGIFTKLMALL